MRKIIDYSFDRTTMKLENLVPLVRESIKNGWEPIGSPVLSNPYMYQFLVKYEDA